MQISISQTGDDTRIVVRGDIDERGAEELKRRFTELKFPKAARVTFDFSGVPHIGSSGIGKLLLFYKAVAADGGSIRIERVPADIYDLLQQLKLDTIFSIAKA